MAKYEGLDSLCLCSHCSALPLLSSLWIPVPIPFPSFPNHLRSLPGNPRDHWVWDPGTNNNQGIAELLIMSSANKASRKVGKDKQSRTFSTPVKGKAGYKAWNYSHSPVTKHQQLNGLETEGGFLCLWLPFLPYCKPTWFIASTSTDRFSITLQALPAKSSSHRHAANSK